MEFSPNIVNIDKNESIDKNTEISDNEKLKKRKENRKKALKSEYLFTKFLNSRDIPFYYIDQSKILYSKHFKDYKITRPDFVAYTKNNTFYIDVKYRKKQNFGKEGEERFYLSQNNMTRLNNFQKEYQSDVWIAFTNNLETPEFYFSSLTEIFHLYNCIKYRMNKSYYDGILEYFDLCPIYIPYSLLYNCFSFNDGFYNNFDTELIKKETENHINKTIDFIYMSFKNTD